MKVACAVLLLALTSSSLGAPRGNLQQRWEEWQMKHGRRYISQGEEEGRRRAWQVNQDLVKAHNNRVDVGFSLEMNQFADGMLSGRQHLKHSPVVDISHDNDLPSAPPASFDWRTKGVISPVSNQGELGDPVAIVAEECVASFQAIKKGEVPKLSSPEIQDCCPMPVGEVFDCIHNFGGLCSESTYPVLTGHCRNNSCQPEVQIQGGKAVPAGQVDQMVDALLERPLAAFIDASKASFEMYTSGIYSDADCSKTVVDHGVQVVGYGEEGGQEFWICKNSWGASWGEDGYIRIKKGSDTCGIESHASYPY
ncbi:procathepsin L-like [Haliotis rufescens]|uniref:procathepsin L-like n=1 Tax=Haliotis rufescens TaxID=6454 RepID=UPI00201F1DFD|nr:procathepsin L-like [Haliotis rufescens]